MKTTPYHRIAAISAASFVLAGCAVQNPDPQDPLQGFNRAVFTFNDKVDRAVLRPVAEGYTYITPAPVRSCISNVFSNVGDVWSAANSFMQARGHDFFNSLGRFLFNTTLGVGGCFDVATANGAPRIRNDFGTTLGVWGFGQGPYLVLPFWGSSTVRDTFGLAGDFTANQYTSVGAIENVPVRNSLYGLEIVQRRANLLDASKTVDRIALDPYSFVRDAYLQRRAAMVLGHNADDESNLPNYGSGDDADSPPQYIDPEAPVGLPN